jgi:2-polyprenyl-6-hydroxyphenyl methylase/3-demethylubiquinone-9 3-methyltransferase
MFRFGQNWKDYALNALDERKLQQARQALAALLGQDDLSGQTFMDIGCGSGLHSVSAALLGAAAVYALDVDLACIEVTQETIRRFIPTDHSIQVRQISVLDGSAMAGLPQTDVVYSWGVLHHTGQMYLAMAIASERVKPGGLYVIAIYNKHVTSPLWRVIKRFYNCAPGFVRRIMYGLFYGLIYAAKWVVTRQNPLDKERGMDFGYDVVDWIGGYPYEYASIDEIVHYVSGLGFHVERIIPAQVGTGCNEFVFRKTN